MSMILTLMVLASSIFTLVSLIIVTPIIKRFSGKLKNTIIFLEIILLLLFVRGAIRIISTSKIILISAPDLETINIFMNFVITFFILMAMLNLNKVVKIIDKKKR